MGSLEYPWFAFDVADWEGATAVMTDEQQGAYVRLLCHGWKEDGLPPDAVAVRQIGRWGAAAWKRIWPALEAKWPIAADGRRRNPRQETERAAAKKRRFDAQAKANKRHAAASATAHAVVGATTELEQVPQLCEVQGSVPQPLQEPVPREIGTLSPPRAGSFEHHPKQLQATASSLYAAWRNVACAMARELKPLEYDPPYSPTVHRALTAHPSIEWWAEVFRKVAESDYLCGRVAGGDGTTFGPASFWWVIEKIERAERIREGLSYRNRERRAKNTDNLAAALKELA